MARWSWKGDRHTSGKYEILKDKLSGGSECSYRFVKQELNVQNDTIPIENKTEENEVTR